MIPIYNIEESIIHSEFKEQSINLPSITNVEHIYLSSTSGKYLALITKARKDQVRKDIDNIINETSFSHGVECPGRSNRYNINTALISYTVAQQKESTPSNVHYHHVPSHTFKRNKTYFTMLKIKHLSFQSIIIYEDVLQIFSRVTIGRHHHHHFHHKRRIYYNFIIHS